MNLYYLNTSHTTVLMALPDETHVMLSYNWKSQHIVSKVYNILKYENIPVWLDIAGGIKDDIYKKYASH